MWDFIFITGTSGIGKTTLAKALLDVYKTVIIEQNMIPEFISRDGTEEMTGELEELTCWENTKAMAFCFHRLGYKNIIVTDIDDLRTAYIPIDFKGYKYITIKLVSTDFGKIQAQMKKRPNGGLVDFVLQEKRRKFYEKMVGFFNRFYLGVIAVFVWRYEQQQHLRHVG